MFYACYVPASGTVYRVKAPGVRRHCGRNHVEFSWTDGAPSGNNLNRGDAAGGDLGGTYPNPGVVRLRGYHVSETEPADGQVLTWNGAATEWRPATPASGVSYHGLLSGLGDDDHPQYVRADGSRGVTGGLNVTSQVTAGFPANVPPIGGEPLEAGGALAGLSLRDRTGGDPAGERWVIYSDRTGGAGSHTLRFWTNSDDQVTMRPNGQVVAGGSASATPLGNEPFEAGGRLAGISLRDRLGTGGERWVVYSQLTGGTGSHTLRFQTWAMGHGTDRASLDPNGNFNTAGTVSAARFDLGLVRVQRTETESFGRRMAYVAVCPGGTKVISGGYQLDFLNTPVPVNRPTESLDGWFVDTECLSTFGCTIDIFAICARVN